MRWSQNYFLTLYKGVFVVLNLKLLTIQQSQETNSPFLSIFMNNPGYSSFTQKYELLALLTRTESSNDHLIGSIHLEKSAFDWSSYFFDVRNDKITIVPISPRIMIRILIQSISMNTKADRLIISHMAMSEIILLRNEMDRFSLIS